MDFKKNLFFFADDYRNTGLHFYRFTGLCIYGYGSNGFKEFKESNELRPGTGAEMAAERSDAAIGTGCERQ